MSLCRCGCGGEVRPGKKFIRGHNLPRVYQPHSPEGLQKQRKAVTIHGHSAIVRGTGKPSRTYTSWQAMKQRCFDVNCGDYPYYGGRGITVCERWLTFTNFLEDMGERPEGMTLDRIDRDGDYEPGNVRWATYKQQTAPGRRTYTKKGA